jgi:hypothetical protein
VARPVSGQTRPAIPELEDPQKNQLLAMSLLREFQDGSLQGWDQLRELWDRESNWKTEAANPRSSARGIPQAMTSLNPETQTPEWLSDPRLQIAWGLNYIMQRYGSIEKALEHHDEKGWY